MMDTRASWVIGGSRQSVNKNIDPGGDRRARRKHKAYPKDLWKTQIVTLGSIPGINTRYQPALHALYSPAAIHETEGGAIECMFGQQRDEKRAACARPNYDLFFLWHTDSVHRHICCLPGHVFAVETRPSAGFRTGSGIKTLHEMQAAQEAVCQDEPHRRTFRPPYFRCIGRD